MIFGVKIQMRLILMIFIHCEYDFFAILKQNFSFELQIVKYLTAPRNFYGKDCLKYRIRIAFMSAIYVASLLLPT